MLLNSRFINKNVFHINRNILLKTLKSFNWWSNYLVDVRTMANDLKADEKFMKQFEELDDDDESLKEKKDKDELNR